MSGPKIDQKEYLKRYLSGSASSDKAKKKKKKREKEIRGKSITIIDASVDVDRLQRIQDDDLEVFQTGEDAPQVVGVIDDRPPELRALDFKNSTRWKVISDDNGFESDLIVQEMDADGRIKKNASKTDAKPKKSVSFGGGPRGNKKDDDDASPPRRITRDDSQDLSPVRKREDSDISPPRRREANSSPPPPRLQRKDCDASPPRRRRDSDSSPPRKRQSGADKSPPRKKRSNSDPSPPRRSRKTNSDDDLSPVRKNTRGTPDYSPPRNRGRRASPSPPRRRRQQRVSEDRSPPRKRHSSRDLSPPRKSSHRNRSPDQSPPRRKGRDSPLREQRQRSPSRRTPEQRKREKRRWDSPGRDRKGTPPDSSPPRRKPRDSSPGPSTSSSSSSNKKMEKTLDGKMAGLQSAKALRVETEKFREREKNVFDAMNEEMSGRDAQVVRRDRKTGRIRNMEEEMERDRQKEEKERERKEIYDRWGKGVKQVEDHVRKRTEEHHEMSKPMARYAGDQDLEDYLRKQERDGDPMLAYIREKEREKKIGSGQVVVMPKYQGSYADNRFGIPPGYRWDGVDRSNGYEKKYFDVQSKKKAGEEEAYRYSTEDM